MTKQSPDHGTIIICPDCNKIKVTKKKDKNGNTIIEWFGNYISGNELVVYEPCPLHFKEEPKKPEPSGLEKINDTWGNDD